MWIFNRNTSPEETSQTEDATAGGRDSRDSGVEEKEIGTEVVSRVQYAKPVPKLRRKLEISSDDDKDSPSTKMWQVYALAGFMIGRWVWARVRERRARKDDKGE